jgi:exodeoxyribonuclease VII large subunit
MSNRNAVQQLGQSLLRQTQFRFRNEKQYFISIKEGMKRNVQNFWTNTRQVLNSMEKNIQNMDPKNVLKRGYSITLLNGKAVRHVNEVKIGDHLETSVFEGYIQSMVTTTQKSSDHE